MTVIAECEYEGSDFEDIFSFDWENTAEQVANAVLDAEDCPYEAEVNLLLMDDEEMHRINLSERGIDRSTDVLSFPAVQYDPPADFSICEENAMDNFDPDSGKLLLGDILISVPKVQAQAGEYGHSTRREFAFLVAHSMLHLLGYDHMVPEEEQVMFSKQEAILQTLGLTRDA